VQWATACGRFSSRTFRTLLAVVLALEALAVVWVAVSVRNFRRAANQDAARPDRDLLFRRIDNPLRPILHPRIVAASQATMAPGEPVIGIVIGGRARAYRLTALDAPEAHLINDRIGDVPVLVTYCNLNQCVRVFTDAPGRGTLDAEVAGLFRSEMVLKVGDGLYFQDSGAPFDPVGNPVPIPYLRLEPSLALWKNWEAAYPDTDVYEGEPGTSAN
jgi:hypothetical protein